MSLRIKVEVDVEGLKREFASIQREIPRAIVRAANRTATTVRAEAVRIIGKKRAIKAKTIREAIAIRKATRALMIAEVVVSGRPIPLRDYAARQTRRGTTVNVTGRRKLVKQGGNAAFQIQRLGSHVFIREGRKRLPVRKLFGPSLPSALTQEAITEALKSLAEKTFRKEFLSAAKFLSTRPRR